MKRLTLELPETLHISQINNKSYYVGVEESDNSKSFVVYLDNNSYACVQLNIMCVFAPFTQYSTLDKLIERNIEDGNHVYATTHYDEFKEWLNS